MPPERAFKDGLWVLDNNDMPVQARGYECPPNDGIWWFPSLGFSCAAFKDEATARRRAVELAEQLKDTAHGRLKKLRALAPTK
jgi:hypothetical protein